METTQLAELLLRVARRMRRRQIDALAPLGITPSQGRALRAIVDAPEPLRMADLATRLGIVPRSVTTLVDALEEAGLARREHDPSSRRSILVVPTDTGLAAVERLREVRRTAAEEIFGPLAPEQRDTLHALLRKLTDDDPGD